MKPTLEEFRGMVKTALRRYESMSGLSDAQIEKYLNDEDSVDTITQAYNYATMQLENGDITEEVFRNGSVTAAAYTLHMLY